MAKYEHFIGMRADEVLDRLGMSQPPYNAFQIAKELNIPVSTEVDIEQNSYSGSITKHPDDSISIWVNPVDGIKRQNFTVAHEIGHLINGDLKDGTLKEFRDNTNTLYRSSAANQKEWKANEFAAELLMPRAEVKKVINEYFKDAETAKISEVAPVLAEKFYVSEAAIRVRLKVLGALK